MPSECTFILPNGQKCRGNAIRNSELCRHHRPQPAGRPAPAKRALYSRLAKWRSLGRELAWLEPAEIPLAIYEILDSLTDRDPWDRLSNEVAGRYLRALLSRLGEVPFPFPQPADPDSHRSPAPLRMPSVPRGPASAQAAGSGSPSGLRLAALPPSPPSPPSPRAVPPLPAIGNLPPDVRAALRAAASKTDNQSLETLVAAFARNGMVPPELLPPEMRSLVPGSTR